MHTRRLPSPVRAWLVALGGVIATTTILGPAPLTAQARPTLTEDDHARWERLGRPVLDPTGRWLAAPITRVDESRELRIHRTDGDGPAIVLEHGGDPEFAPAGTTLAYRVGVSPGERERLESEDEPVRERLGLLDLASGTDTTLMEVESMAWSDDGRWLAVLGPPPSDSVGADLTVVSPAGDHLSTLANVDAFAWQDGGHLLALVLRTASGRGDGVAVFEPDADVLRTLDGGPSRYRGLAWREDASDLAVLRSVTRDDREGDAHDVLLWRGVVAGATPPPPTVLASRGRADLPDTLRVTEHEGLRWSVDGGIVFVGLRPWPAKQIEGEAVPDSTRGDGSDDVGPSEVQVWHWDDDRILRMQEEQAALDRRRTHLAAWHPDDDRLVHLGRDLMEPLTLLADGRHALEADADPYHVERRFGSGRADWYVVDVATGERTLLARGLEWGVETGPTGRRILYHEADRWTALDLDTGETTPLGEAPDPRFTQPADRYDFPGPRPPWGVGGWLEDESAVFLHDRLDVWHADLETGALERLTRGAEDGLEHRVVNPDPDARPFEADPAGLPRGGALWLALRDPRTKASGYAVVEPDGRVRELLRRDALVSGLTRAPDAERYALRVERFDDSPDVFVGGERLDDLRQLTHTNPFQDGYAWGRAELLGYTTGAGHDLQAILMYPADFDPDRRYPLILYQYERLSDGLHRYVVPDSRSYYNAQVWSQNGYFVLMPDIVYEPGRPGPSALDAVEHALDAALAAAPVDPDRLGLIGHSWGGYQAAYLPTRTHRFAASVAGAPITNFLSFMGAVHWNGGFPETGHWETGQARMAVPYWEDLEGHLESSPAHFIADLETPILVMHGDADGVVDFRQGLEFYNYARRAGKRVLLLVYPGADHGLREEEDQVDYHRRILEWFGHYLAGEPAPDWIEGGQSWLARERALEEAKKAKERAGGG